jgi:acyl dehydratase
MSTRGRAGSKPLRVGDAQPGHTVTATLVENLTRTQIVQYAGASGDYNPIHTDERYATEVGGYPSVFAHGMLTMGLAGRLLTDYVGDGRLTQFGARFVAQVWPGDTLTGTCEVEALGDEGGEPVAELRVTVTNQHGRPVLTGTARARLDP